MCLPFLEEVREIQSVRGIQPERDDSPLLALNMEELLARSHRRAASGSRGQPPAADSQQGAPPCPNCKEGKLADNLNELGTQFSPQPPEERPPRVSVPTRPSP